MTVMDATPPDLTTRLMALFHDIGKVKTRTEKDGKVSFINHEDVGANMAKDILKRLKFSNAGVNIDAVVLGVKNHMRLKQHGKQGEKASDKALRKFVTVVGDGIDNIMDLIHADNISHASESSMPDQVSRLKDRINTLQTTTKNVDLKRPINGNELKAELNIPQGPMIGKINDIIDDALLEKPDLTRDEALNLAKEFLLNQNINEIRILMKKLI
jgi:putative nucleotidyltransferase with HDIG domain